MQKNGLLYVAQTNEETWGSFRSNEVVSYICADWSAGVLKQYIPEQAGLWKMAPLPKLTADSARTSCNGGTGLTMMKYTKKDKETLWDFMKWSRVEPKNSAAMYTILGLYPCVYDAMPLVNGPNEYYSNQDVGGLYAELAREMPIQNQAAWRGNFWEFMGQNAYDFYTGAITVDELLEIAVTETEAQM
jgi:ABC-type glycerol-3-phosphate transport system substrate-binding protein